MTEILAAKVVDGPSQAATSFSRVCLSGMRRVRDWVVRTASSDSAMSEPASILGGFEPFDEATPRVAVVRGLRNNLGQIDCAERIQSHLPSPLGT
jgi:hypothetical protein